MVAATVQSEAVDEWMELIAICAGGVIDKKSMSAGWAVSVTEQEESDSSWAETGTSRWGRHLMVGWSV